MLGRTGMIRWDMWASTRRCFESCHDQHVTTMPGSKLLSQASQQWLGCPAEHQPLQFRKALQCGHPAAADGRVDQMQLAKGAQIAHHRWHLRMQPRHSGSVAQCAGTW